jgi:hypothetical protein
MKRGKGGFFTKDPFFFDGLYRPVPIFLACLYIKQNRKISTRKFYEKRKRWIFYQGSVFFRWSLSARSDFPLPVFFSSKTENKHTEIL